MLEILAIGVSKCQMASNIALVTTTENVAVKADGGVVKDLPAVP